MSMEELRLDVIEVITLNDNTEYYELANTDLNTFAEYAAENGMIKEVRILKINIPHSTRVERVESYYMGMFDMPTFEMKEWKVWDKTPEIKELIEQVVLDNKVS